MFTASNSRNNFNLMVLKFGEPDDRNCALIDFDWPMIILNSTRLVDLDATASGVFSKSRNFYP